MKVPFKQRTWGANMGLVFQLCISNFSPLILVLLALELPGYLIHYLSTGDPGFDAWAADRLRMGFSEGGIFLWLFLIPIKQACCLYIVARRYEGVRVPVTEGIRSVFLSVPRLVVYALATTIALIIAFAPGAFLGYTTMNPFVFLTLSGIPLVWMYTGESCWVPR